ncbi:hypothetical protein CHK_1594 [Christensenella hongkongensis]|uniref:Uncharacterized protein n=1 Tax=Christensenella hongkongensis TaxID=270498 RepID=A0A0M2NL94_9FIRM|nr:hypothetical protein CHK_1594 [Christensenella hongkongensis]
MNKASFLYSSKRFFFLNFNSETKAKMEQTAAIQAAISVPTSKISLL